MIIFKVILLNVVALVGLFCVILLIKNGITYRNHTIIADAIFDYRMDCVDKAAKNGTIVEEGVKYEVGYADMRDYNETVMRIFDWGYKNILPEDKFEIIKPFIHKRNGG